MRSVAIFMEVAVAVALWTFVVWLLRQRRAGLAAGGAQSLRGYRLHATAAVWVTVGVTCLDAWLITDATGPHWLHSVSLPATLVCIAVGAVVAGYAGWVGGP